MTSFRLKAEDLKLWETPCHWQPLEEEQADIGRVCCLIKDRLDPWNLFVIVEVLPEFDANGNEVRFSTWQNKLRVIYPRLRLENGRLILGQDKSNDNNLSRNKEDKHASTCQVYSFNRGYDFPCTCKLTEDIRLKYALTFQDAVNNEGDYKIHTIDGEVLNQSLTSVECIKQNSPYINFLDQPIETNEETLTTVEEKVDIPRYVYVITTQTHNSGMGTRGSSIAAIYDTMEEAMINLPETHTSRNRTVNFSISKVEVGKRTKEDILSGYYSD